MKKFISLLSGVALLLASASVVSVAAEGDEAPTGSDEYVFETATDTEQTFLDGAMRIGLKVSDIAKMQAADNIIELSDGTNNLNWNLKDYDLEAGKINYLILPFAEARNANPDYTDGQKRLDLTAVTKVVARAANYEGELDVEIVDVEFIDFSALLKTIGIAFYDSASMNSMLWSDVQTVDVDGRHIKAYKLENSGTYVGEYYDNHAEGSRIPEAAQRITADKLLDLGNVAAANLEAVFKVKLVGEPSSMTLQLTSDKTQIGAYPDLNKKQTGWTYTDAPDAVKNNKDWQIISTLKGAVDGWSAFEIKGGDPDVHNIQAMRLLYSGGQMLMDYFMLVDKTKYDPEMENLYLYAVSDMDGKNYKNLYTGEVIPGEDEEPEWASDEFTADEPYNTKQTFIDGAMLIGLKISDVKKMQEADNIIELTDGTNNLNWNLANYTMQEGKINYMLLPFYEASNANSDYLNEATRLDLTKVTKVIAKAENYEGDLDIEIVDVDFVNFNELLKTLGIVFYDSASLNSVCYTSSEGGAYHLVGKTHAAEYVHNTLNPAAQRFTPDKPLNLGNVLTNNLDVYMRVKLHGTIDSMGFQFCSQDDPGYTTNQFGLAFNYADLPADVKSNQDWQILTSTKAGQGWTRNENVGAADVTSIKQMRLLMQKSTDDAEANSIDVDYVMLVDSTKYTGDVQNLYLYAVSDMDGKNLKNLFTGEEGGDNKPNLPTGEHSVALLVLGTVAVSAGILFGSRKRSKK